MESLLRSIGREPDGVSIEDVIRNCADGNVVTLRFSATKKLEKKEENPIQIDGSAVRKGHSYIVKVKKWMTKSSTDGVDFMKKWNQDIPMPFMIMTGTVLNETRGMVYMELHAQVMQTTHCMRCGRLLTHPVSRLYGLGPECGGHAHINPFQTEEELQEALEDVKQKLNRITWKGWIAKSGIESAQEVR